VSLNPLLDDLTLLTRHKLNQHKVALIRKLDPKLPLVLADATQIEQVFLNLTFNAVEAMPHGGQLTIVSRPQRTGDHLQPSSLVVVEFKDTGDGMTEEQQKRAFTSLLSTTKQKGTGLGLAIVSKIVEAHRGRIEVKSRPGHGTTVILSLPSAPGAGTAG
jgi:signal transduction histidine kinase